MGLSSFLVLCFHPLNFPFHLFSSSSFLPLSPPPSSPSREYLPHVDVKYGRNGHTFSSGTRTQPPCRRRLHVPSSLQCFITLIAPSQHIPACSQHFSRPAAPGAPAVHFHALALKVHVPVAPRRGRNMQHPELLLWAEQQPLQPCTIATSRASRPHLCPCQ